MIDVDLWISCANCLQEIEEGGNEFSHEEYSQYQVGIELETNSLIVRCGRHNLDMKLFRLHESEADIIPKKCSCCE